MLSLRAGMWPSSVWWQAAAVTMWVKVQLTGLRRASCSQSCLFACVWKAWSLVSASSCLLQWCCVCPPFSPPTQVTSSPSAREAEQAEGALVFSSNAKTAAAADRSSGDRRCDSSSRWPVKESALQSHSYTSSIFCVFLNLFQCVFGSGQ